MRDLDDILGAVVAATIILFGLFLCWAFFTSP